MPIELPSLTQEYLAANGLIMPRPNWLGTETTYPMSPIEAQQPMQTPPMQKWIRGGEGYIEPESQNWLRTSDKPIPIETPIMENPALTKFVSEEQAQAGAKQAEQSPIAAGIEAARASPIAERYGLSPEQKREALGHALVAFAGQMGASQNRSQLGAMVEGLNPALQAMTAERQRALAANQKAEEMQFDKYYKTEHLKAERMRVEAYTKGMERWGKDKPMTYKDVLARQNQIKNTNAHIINFTEKNAKRLEKVLDKERINGLRISNLPQAERDAFLNDFWEKENEAYNIAIKPYLEILKAHGEIGADVIGKDIRTGKYIIDENYKEAMPPEEGVIPPSMNKPQIPYVPAPQTSGLPDPRSLTPEQRKAILAQANKGT